MTRHPHPRRLPRRSARRRSGQVLVIVVVMAIILLVMALFLVDLQGMVRTRMKTQNGVDAAALAAASWQGRSLNMIGEINLIKASTLMYATFPVDPSLPDPPFDQSMDMLSQMQARITYVGPLLAYNAAQQAAKANQMRRNPAYDAALAQHITLVENLYPAIFADDANGYAWMDPYRDMLQQIHANGVAAKPVNSDYLLRQPNINGVWAGLATDPDFYAAVHGNWYCWFLYTRGLDPSASYGFDDLSYSRNAAYHLGSEFLPLYVNIPALRTEPNYTVMQPFMNDRGLSPLPPDLNGDLPLIQWATFGYEWDDTSLYEVFNDEGYLRSNFKSQYMGNGAAARFLCNSQPSLITGRWTWEYGQDPNDATNTALGDRDALAFSDKEIGGSSFAEHGSDMNRAEAHYEQLRGADGVLSSAAAKPFGSLGDARASAAGIVLPVFTDVRLLPVPLVPETLQDINPTFYYFLTDYFGHPSYPDVPQDVRDRWSWYISALEAFADPDSSFRQGLTDYAVWRADRIAGLDGIIGTADDGRDPCQPYFTGGGGGGGGSRGGPSTLH